MSYLTNPYRFVAACAESNYQNSPVTGGSGGRTIEGVSRAGVGFQINAGHVLVDKKVLRVTVKLDNDNRTPDSTIYVRVRDNTSGGLVGTFNTMDATSLTSSAVEYTFGEDDGNGGVAVDMSADNIITVEYPDTGNAIQIRMSNTTTINYVTNATTLYAINTLYNSWASWEQDYPPVNYFWFWLELVYCN